MAMLNLDDLDVILLDPDEPVQTKDMCTNTPIFSDHYVNRPLKIFMSNTNGRDAATQVEHDCPVTPTAGKRTSTATSTASTSTQSVIQEQHLTPHYTTYTSSARKGAITPASSFLPKSPKTPVMKRDVADTGSPYWRYVPHKGNTKRVVKKNVVYEVVMKSQRVGTDSNVPCFYGYDSIVMKGNLNELTAISPAVFDQLVEILGKFKPRTLRLVDHLLMFLVKIRLNLNFNALSAFFDIHPSTIRQNFNKILKILSEKTANYFSNLPDIEEVMLSLPRASADFNGCRIIVDCLPVKSENPKDANEDLKFFIGITPNCKISFLSPLFDGTVPHNYIQHSGPLRAQLLPNDSIVTLRQLPWFGWQTIPAKVPDVTQQIRIASENLITRIKLFKILQQCPATMMNQASSLVHVIAVIMNMCIDEKKEISRQLEVAKIMKIDIDADHCYSNSNDGNDNNNVPAASPMEADELEDAILNVDL